MGIPEKQFIRMAELRTKILFDDHFAMLLLHGTHEKGTLRIPHAFVH